MNTDRAGSAGVTRDFADCLLALAPAAAEPAAQAVATSLLIDGLAVAALGSGQTGPRILAGLACEQGGTASATLIGHGQRVSASEAARVNGAAMHVLDYEPMWNPANHSLSTTLPALLALAEMLGRRRSVTSHRLDGRRLLTALVLGIEAQQRMRLASGQLEPGGLMFHPPGAVGAFGSAVACGVLLGLDAATLAQAVGIAASRAGGIQGNIGSMTKALHCGQSAMAGFEAALMASRGFTADRDAVGGPRGYGRAFYGETFDPASLTAPHALFVLDPGPAFKFFPSQYGTHFVITAALAARGALWQHGLTPQDIEGIEAMRIVVPPMPYVDRPLPATGLDGKFSFQYVAALAVIDGKVDVASFTDERRFRADMVRLLPRITVEGDAAREGTFDRMHVDVQVRLTDGRQSEAACDGPPGIWGRPVKPELLAGKALDCLSGVYTPGRAQEIVARARDFTKMDLPDVLALMDLLGAA